MPIPASTSAPPTESVSAAGPVARALLALHLAAGPILGILGTGAVVAGLLTGREVPLALFLAVALPGMALGVIPSNTTMLACGALFGWSGAGLLFPGLLAAALPGFLLIRRFFRPEARLLLARHEAARDIVHRLETRSFPVATLLRIAPVSTFAWTNAILSASAIRFPAYLAATLLGIAPRLALLTWAGRSAGDLTVALRQGTGGTTALIGLGVSIASLGLLALFASKMLTRPA